MDMIPSTKRKVLVLCFIAVFICITAMPAWADSISDNHYPKRFFHLTPEATPWGVHETWGFKDEKGNVTIKPVYKDAGDFSEGLAAVKFPGKVVKAHPGFGKVVTVKLPGRYGFINTKGETVIKPQFDYASYFEKGVAEVGVNLEPALVSKTGKIKELNYQCRGKNIHECNPPEGFPVVSINSHYEPVPIKLMGNLPIGVKGGSFLYYLTKRDYAGRFGFLIGGKLFYLVSVTNRKFLDITPTLDVQHDFINFIYNDYVFVEYIGDIYLFKLKSHSVKLLDILLGDFSILPQKNMGAKVIDGIPYFYSTVAVNGGYVFDLYFRIINGKLRVDLNPSLYKRLFNERKKEMEREGIITVNYLGKQPDEESSIDIRYFVYGLLSKELTISGIQRSLHNNKYNKELLKDLAQILNNKENWDKMFHNPEVTIKLLEHNFNREGK